MLRLVLEKICAETFGSRVCVSRYVGAGCQNFSSSSSIFLRDDGVFPDLDRQRKSSRQHADSVSWRPARDRPFILSGSGASVVRVATFLRRTRTIPIRHLDGRHRALFRHFRRLGGSRHRQSFGQWIGNDAQSAESILVPHGKIVVAREVVNLHNENVK